MAGSADGRVIDGLGDSAKDVAIAKNHQELAGFIDVGAKVSELRASPPDRWSIKAMRTLLALTGQDYASFVDKGDIRRAVDATLAGFPPPVARVRDVVRLPPLDTDGTKGAAPREPAGPPAAAAGSGPEAGAARDRASGNSSDEEEAFRESAPVGHLLAQSQKAKERGNAAFKARDFVKAAHQYSMAIRLDPGNHVLFSNRSAAYASQGSWDKAHADACRCVELRPGWGKGYARKGAALVGQGQAGEALKVYKQGLAAEPGNAACKDGIADAKEAIRRNQRAYEEFTGEKHPGAAA